VSGVRVFRVLLRLYPSDYAALFADEMINAFEQGCNEYRSQRRAPFVRFVVRELVGLIIGLIAEWIAKLTTDTSTRGRSLPDLRKMRPAGVPYELWFAAAGTNYRQTSLPMEVAQAQERVRFLLNARVHAATDRDFQAARSYCYEEYRERDKVRFLKKKYGLE